MTTERDRLASMSDEGLQTELQEMVAKGDELLALHRMAVAIAETRRADAELPYLSIDIRAAAAALAAYHGRAPDA